MSNCEVFQLPLVEVELHQVREVCRCALHTVVFNRALGHVAPADVDAELFDVTYCRCGDAAVDAAIEAGVSEFVAALERAQQQQQQQQQPQPQPQPPAQLRLAFYERRRPQSGGGAGFGGGGSASGAGGGGGVGAWFARPASEERLYWEAWVLNIALASPGPFSRDHSAALAYTDAAAARQAKLQAAVEGLIAAIVRAVNTKRHHLPPVVSSGAVTFPFDITVVAPAGGGARGAFGLTAVRRMLASATPPPVLGT